MYRFSRSIYRELAPLVSDHGSTGNAARQHLLESSEATMRRLAYDRRYFARPARTLFGDVRVHFPMTEQLRAYKVIERNVNLALELLAQLPADVSLDGQPQECRASTRKGTPCRRHPLPGAEYCPSHKHLEEPVEEHGQVGAAA